MPLDTKNMGINMGSDFPAVWVVPEALQQLVECGETDLVDELLTIFQSDTASRLAVLGRAVGAGDVATVKAEAHTIKGSAVQVGANRVAEACLQMETEARKSPPTELDWLLSRLRRSFDEACGMIAEQKQSTRKQFQK
jgi:HPt (histidine-containing phosphotransfer) domain-containing protein